MKIGCKVGVEVTSLTYFVQELHFITAVSAVLPETGSVCCMISNVSFFPNSLCCPPEEIIISCMLWPKKNLKNWATVTVSNNFSLNFSDVQTVNIFVFMLALGTIRQWLPNHVIQTGMEQGWEGGSLHWVLLWVPETV